MVNYKKDGYPIYGHLDQGDVTPTGPDSCNGHTAATAEFTSGVYHYHAFATEASNYPSCLKGASVSSLLTPSIM